MDDVAYFRQLLIKSFVVVEQAGGDEAELARLNEAITDGTQIVVNGASFDALVCAATQMIHWAVDRATRPPAATKADVLRELALWSAQEAEDASGGE